MSALGSRAVCPRAIRLFGHSRFTRLQLRPYPQSTPYARREAPGVGDGSMEVLRGVI